MRNFIQVKQISMCEKVNWESPHSYIDNTTVRGMVLEDGECVLKTADYEIQVLHDAVEKSEIQKHEETESTDVFQCRGEDWEPVIYHEGISGCIQKLQFGRQNGKVILFDLFCVLWTRRLGHLLKVEQWWH